MKKKSIVKELRDYLMITIAMVSYCIGWNVFLLPNNITTGGVPGISSVVYWGTGIPVQVTYFVINAFLLIAALKILGWKFCVKTIYAVVVLTSLTALARHNLADTHLLSDQPFMASIIGAIFCGSGVGLGLANNGSTGGTDIVAAIVNKYRDISLGRVIMLCDIVIITSSYLVLHNWEQVIYGYVVLMVSVSTRLSTPCVVACSFSSSRTSIARLPRASLSIPIVVLRSSKLTASTRVIR